MSFLPSHSVRFTASLFPPFLVTATLAFVIGVIAALQNVNVTNDTYARNGRGREVVRYLQRSHYFVASSARCASSTQFPVLFDKLQSEPQKWRMSSIRRISPHDLLTNKIGILSEMSRVRARATCKTGDEKLQLISGIFGTW